MSSVLVTGSRNLNAAEHKAFVWITISDWCERLQGSNMAGFTVIHGKSPKGGADLYAEQWAKLWASAGVIERAFPPNFDLYGYPGAYHQRNQEMVEQKPDMILAFFYGLSRGTQDTVTRAKLAGIKTFEARL